MRRGAIVVIALVVGTVAMLSNLGYRKRQQERAILSDRVDEYASKAENGRYVDIGVRLRTVVADPDGVEYIDGKPKLRIIRERIFGGMLDTRAKPAVIVGPSRAPVTWYCSQEQEIVILHSDDDPLGQLARGSEGAGKSTAIAMWIYFRWLEMIGEGREIGCVAPTENRIKMVQDELFKLWPAAWWRYKVAAMMLVFVDGTRVQFVSTTMTSAKSGSRIQGYNWSAAAQDELQDQVAVFDDVGSRGRSAKDGRYKQLGSCTAKDDPAFRSLKGRVLSAVDKHGKNLWVERTMLIANSPFIHPDFIAQKRAITNDREFRRRFGAEDLPAEARLYFNWSRDLNMRMLPATARKVTSIAIRAKTGNPQHALLAGHDPGTAKSATIFLDAFEIPKEPGWSWWVRGEIFGKYQTTEQSALAIIARARTMGTNHRAGSEIVHVRAQPFGQANDKPDQDLYRIFAQCGLDVRAAQHKADGSGTGFISKDSRIDMVNRLFCNSDGLRRLFVECNDRRQPCAPILVESLESAERDQFGRAEAERKDEYDKSDCPAALGYALWPFEKAASVALQDDIRKGIRR